MKHSVSLIAPAKLNLNLYVKEKLNNGYHLLNSDICFLDLYDEIIIKRSNLDIINVSNKSTFFFKEENISFICSVSLCTSFSFFIPFLGSKLHT